MAGLYGLLRSKRAELVDFAVPRTAAARFLAHEPLYRPGDGHYQYKYLPAFALAMAPFAWLPKRFAEFVWFTLMVAMTWALLYLSVETVPDRRLTTGALFWLTLLLNGKFLVKELMLGQFNLPVALLMIGAVIAARRGRVAGAGALVGAGVFVKPYTLVLVPWLAWRFGRRALIPFGVVLAIGLILPAISYGWNGNVTLLGEWYRTVSETTGANLLGHENISLAATWAKWLAPGEPASVLALASAVVALVGGMVLMARSRHVHDPHYLDAAYFLLLVPLLSPQGWDYVLLIAMPAYALLVDRWKELPAGWRAAAVTGFLLTSFTIFDLLGRSLYTHLMQLGVVTVGAALLAICLIQVRSLGSA